MKISAIICSVLCIIGGVVWGLIGIFNFNVLTAIFGLSTAGIVIERIIYSLVGVSALWMIFYLFMFRPFSNKKSD